VTSSSQDGSGHPRRNGAAEVADSLASIEDDAARRFQRIADHASPARAALYRRMAEEAEQVARHERQLSDERRADDP
jgi:hypothetical protein